MIRWRTSTAPASLKSDALKSKAAAPPGGLAYAVGDVHGRLDLLDGLLDILLEDRARKAPAEPAMLVFLGDLIDRGPDSAAVVERVLSLSNAPEWTTVALRGNHEQALLDFLDSPATGPEWVLFGGGATLASYGVEQPRGRSCVAGWAEASERLARAIRGRHRAFFEQTPLYLEWGQYIFVHAGVRPGVPLSRQSKKDLLGIREAFLAVPGPCDRIVVHGHTPAMSNATLWAQE